MVFSQRLSLLGSILLMVALAFLCSPQAPSAHAASVSASAHALTRTSSALSPDFTCPDRTICLFQNNDFTGQVSTCATDTCRGAWFSTTVGGIHAGSVNDNSNSIFWLADVQDDIEICLPPGGHELDHTYGHYWVEYGITSCTDPNAYTPSMVCLTQVCTSAPTVGGIRAGSVNDNSNSLF